MRAWYMLAMVTAAYVLSGIDRKVPFILADAIKHDLSLSDTQLGLVTGAMFAVVYSTIAFPLASLADRRSRKWILGWAVIIWSGFTAAGGFAMNFWSLTASRMGVAAGEAACTPAAHSMIGDEFAPRYRSRALGVYFFGSQLGILIGLALGGWINQVANWRVAMFMLGVPGILLGLLIFLTVKEPRRTAHGETPSEAEAAGVKVAGPSVRSVVWTLMKQPTLVHLILGAAMANIVTAAIQAFFPSHVIRTFHLGTGEVGLSLGLALGVGGIIGTLLGGIFGDWLRQRAPWKALAFVSATVLVTGPCLVLAVNAKSYPVALAMLFIAHTCTMVNPGPGIATLQSLMKSNTHAVATATYLFVVSGLGLAVGPLVTGMLSDSFSHLGSQRSLQLALMIMTAFTIWGAIHYLLSALSLRRHDQGKSFEAASPASPA